MFYFLIPLILGFCSNLASAFTDLYSKKWGKGKGTFVTILLRDIFGIPVWAIGFLMAVKETGSLFFRESVFTLVIGWGLIIAGGLIIILALVTIRLRAAAPSEEDKLVHTGIYSVVRHPIHSGTFLEFMGLFIIWPSLTVAIASLIGIIWIYFQSKFEEIDLIKRIPGYSDYMNKVPRFIPKKIFK
jgi:protein-S-isoprenylcysteine O-methyltransferase Ste14